MNVLNAAVAQTRSFDPPKPKKKDIRIQYNAKVEDVNRIENYLKRPAMGGSEIGRYTFKYFLKNEVGED